mgnify:CR=1 FL=1
MTWVLGPILLWLAAMQMPPVQVTPPPLLPGTSASSASLAQATGHPTVPAHLVVAGQHRLGPDDHSFYDAVMNRVRADTEHVESAVATWSDPLTADIATSDDHRGAYGLLWLNGELGSPQTRSAVDAINDIIASVPAPPGVRAYLSGPATVFTAPATPSWPTALAIFIAVLALVSVALQRVCRPNVRLAVLAGVSGVSLFAAAPVAYLLATARVLTLSPLSAALGGVLTVCAAVDFALVVTRGYHHRRRDGHDHDDALTGAYLALLRHISIAAPVLTAMLAASIFLHTPMLREVTAPAAVGIVIALLAVATCGPVMIDRTADSRAWTDSWAAGRMLPQLGRTGLAISIIIVCVVAAGGATWSARNTPTSPIAQQGPFTAAQLLPDVVTIDADHDQRNPDGLATINRVTRRLMALPGVIRVQSASAPAGTPWNEATFAFQAGNLGEQAQRRASAATSQLGPVKSLNAALDALNGALDRVRHGDAVNDFSRVAGEVGTGIQTMMQASGAIMHSLAPIQEWMGGISDCTNNSTCVAAKRLMEPFDNVMRVAQQLASFTSRPHRGPSLAADDTLGQLQSVINQFRALLPGLNNLLDTVLPQISSLTTSMKDIGHSFGDNNQGAFYLPRSVLVSPAYRSVRESMFSPDGHRTRLLVYGALDNTNLPLWQRPTAIAQLLATQSKEGALADGVVHVTGTGVAAQLLHDLAQHDATALGLCLTFATVLAALAMMRHRRTMLLLCAVALTFVLAAAAVWISAMNIVVGEITWLALLFVMAVAGPMAVHHQVAMAGSDGAATRPFRQPANVLCLAGIGFGLLLWLAPGDSVLHRAGLVMAFGLSANATATMISRRNIAQLPARLRALRASHTAAEPTIEPAQATPEQPAPVAPRPVRPPAVRPIAVAQTAAASAASRRAKALVRQYHFFYLRGPVPAEQRDRVGVS